MTDVNVPSKSNNQNNYEKKHVFAISSATDEKADPDPYQNVTDPQHCLRDNLMKVLVTLNCDFKKFQIFLQIMFQGTVQYRYIF